jgi:sugar phosphate isomerase/epimerase
MMSLFRRCCVLAVVLCFVLLSQAATPLRVGMELWTYRHQLEADLPGTLAAIRSLGFTDIETASFYTRTAPEFHRLLHAAGLTCSSIIADYDSLKNDLPAVIADAKALDAKYVITAGFPHEAGLTTEDVRRAATDFNAWGARLQGAGLQFGYHPHGFEFVPSGAGNLFDLMLAETKPALVTYELDTYHFLEGGADPVRYLEKHPNRFALVHLKDMAKGTPTGVITSRPVGDSSVVLGTGLLDWPAFFAAARKAGVKLYYIEDESPAAPAQVPVSVKYLKSSGMWAP